MCSIVNLLSHCLPHSAPFLQEDNWYAFLSTGVLTLKNLEIIKNMSVIRKRLLAYACSREVQLNILKQKWITNILIFNSIPSIKKQIWHVRWWYFHMKMCNFQCMTSHCTKESDFHFLNENSFFVVKIKLSNEYFNLKIHLNSFRTLTQECNSWQTNFSIQVEAFFLQKANFFSNFIKFRLNHVYMIIYKYYDTKHSDSNPCEANEGLKTKITSGMYYTVRKLSLYNNICRKILWHLHKALFYFFSP